MSIKDRFQKNRVANAASLNQDVLTSGSKKFEADSRFLPLAHEKGKAALTITLRLLPEGPEPESKNFAPLKKWFADYTTLPDQFKKPGAQGKKGFYSEPNLGPDDPMQEIADILYNTDDKAAQEWVKRSRSNGFVTNVLVVDYKAKPELNGRVFLYEFKQEIFSLIEKSIKGYTVTDPVTGEEVPMAPINPYDVFDSHNLILNFSPATAMVNNKPIATWSTSRFQRNKVSSIPDELLEKIYSEKNPLIFKLDTAIRTWPTLDQAKQKVDNLFGHLRKPSGEDFGPAVAARQAAKTGTTVVLPASTASVKPAAASGKPKPPTNSLPWAGGADEEFPDLGLGKIYGSAPSDEDDEE